MRNWHERVIGCPQNMPGPKNNAGQCGGQKALPGKSFGVACFGFVKCRVTSRLIWFVSLTGSLIYTKLAAWAMYLAACLES